MLLLGVGFGLRHAVDADHIVAVSTLVQRESGVVKAARIAALWGAGHTLTFLGLGLAIVFAELRLSPTFERTVELIVGAMLFGLGFWRLLQRRGARGAAHAAPPASGVAVHARPLLVGLIHGLAGSAGAALLATTTISSRALAIVYLSMVALGTMLGMVALTILIAWPIGLTMQREGALKSTIQISAALLSMALGLAVVVQAGPPARWL